MPIDTLHLKIELLEQQFETIKASKFYTENEIDKFLNYLKSEIRLNKAQLSFLEYPQEVTTTKISPGKSLYGMTPEQYLEGIKFHNECFERIRK